MNFSPSQLFTDWFEFFAFVTSVACVALITVKRPHGIGIGKWHWFSFDFNWNWPTGVITSCLYFFIFWDFKLWMNAGLQIFYILTGFIGWYQWLRGGPKKDELPIQRLNVLQWIASITAIVAITVACWPAMVHFKDAAPFWDSAIFGLSVVAQMVMTRKFREHWWIWLVEDFIAVVLFWNLGLGLTSVLYFIFGSLCIRGMFTWNTMEKSEAKGRMSLVD